MEQFQRRRCERFTIQKAWARSILEGAENVRRSGTDGSWQHQTPCKEEYEPLTDLRFEGVSMRHVDKAGRSGDWAVLKFMCGWQRRHPASTIGGIQTAFWSFKSARIAVRRRFSGPRTATGYVRKSGERAQSLGKPAEIW